MQLLMSGLGALIMLGVCGLSGFFIIADERRGAEATATVVAPPAATVARDISSRRIDPEPLGLDEVFPQRELSMTPGASPYRLKMRHIDTECQVATTGTLGRLLQDHGCSQVVRATFAAPLDGYLVTAGIFNLADDADARSVSKQIKPMVDAGRGGFAAMAVEPGAVPVEPPPAQLGWHTRGHYLVYCVIARAAGEIIRDDDPYTQRIVYDLIESYLRDGVIERRATVPV